MTHPEPVEPNAPLEQFEVGLDRDHIRSVQVPEAEAYWHDPQKFAIPDKATDDGPDMEKVHDMFVAAMRKTAQKAFLPLTGGDVETAKNCLKVARQRLGVNPEGETEGETFDEVVENWIDEVYHAMVPRFRNPSLTKHVMLAGGGLDVNSECVHPLLLTAGSGCSLEGAYGFGLNLFGMYQQIGPDDPMSLWVPDARLEVGDIGFCYERQRSRMFLNAYQKSRAIVSLGAGWLPEVRHAEMILGGTPDFCGKTLYAVDKDPRIPVEMFGDWMTDSGLRVLYEKNDIAAALPEMAKEHYGSIDLVYAKGVMSFMPNKLVPILTAALAMLRNGGKFMFDLQLDHDIMKRDILLFSWGGMLTEGKLHLMTNSEAYAFVGNAISSYCSDHNITLEWSCTSDDASDPLGFIFTVTKRY